MPSAGSKKPQSGRIIVRTGCVTCKTRRVKCDERKPTCLRCEKAGRGCEGYRILPTPSPTSFDRALVPSSCDSPRGSRQSSTSSVSRFSSPAPGPSQILFQSEHQQRYFNIFCQSTAKQLSGYLESPLWSTIVPQACESEPSIRHAVIALAALDFTTLRQKSQQSGLLGFPEVSEHHEFALREYHLAIKLLRDRQKGHVDLRTALIACLCCVCFETFHGNSTSALNQVYTGMNLLHAATAASHKASEDFLRYKTVAPGIEQEIVEALHLLGQQGLSFLNRQPIVYHEQWYHAGQDLIESMPPIFSGYEEARYFKGLLLARGWHFQHALVQYDFEYNGSQAQRFGWQVFDAVVHPLSRIPDFILEETTQHISELAHWKDAFAPLLSRAQTEAGEEDFILAATLKIQHLACTIITGNAISLSQESYDSYLPEFNEIISLATALISHENHSSKHGCFTFLNQFIIPVYICALKCRYRPIRQQAMSILSSSHQREGLWDSFFVASILEWIMELEEQGMDDNGYIPEAARARAVHATFDLQQRHASVSCRLPGINGILETREAVITW